ncbi:MAG: polyprenyl synthetase family protein [Balneolaceae bacterium]|nr:polyprenyl synthetase family protein [Balneolaceae bacterium]
MEEQLTLAKRFQVENPHPESAVEWWFFNGFFEGENIGRRSFMVSFFRNNLAKTDRPVKNGFSLLFSILNPETGENHVVSQIDEPVLNAFVNLLKEENNNELDRDLFRVLLNEIERHGPTQPVQLKQADGDLTGETLQISWEDFTLVQNRQSFDIQFPFLEDKRSCSIQLYPETERFSFEMDDGDLEDGKVPYHCYPELTLTGMVGSEKITGRAWMDHQWGNKGWFVSGKDHNQLLGWDWFGINLDDGTNLIVMIHKYAKTNEIVNSTSVVLKKGESPVFHSDVDARPVEHWESPQTHIKYPISWEIDIADLDLSLIFQPLARNQEIPVFGFARAIWEGEGTVYGTKNGNEVTGRARAEFCGYGFIFDFQNYLKELADRVDKRIEEFFPKKMNEAVIEKFVGKPHWKNEPNAHTEMISKPVWDLILRRGKRWRPIFGILMQEALGKSSVNYERSWCLAELIHSGALIVDDIEDNSELRRGEPTLHIKYGLDVALNAGNLLYFLPTVELFHHEHLNDSQKLRIHEIMMDTCLKGHFGQTLDIYWSRNMNIDSLTEWLDDDIESKILQMYDYKTAAGPKGLARVAAVLNDVDGEIKDAAVSFARSFAVAFQIIDDVHNFSSSPRWTKVQGEDIANGKLTFAIAKAIKMLNGNDSDRLKQILCNEELRNSESTLGEAIELVKCSGALETCKKEAQAMSVEAWDHFAEVVPSCEPKIMLNMLHLKMLDLAYDT